MTMKQQRDKILRTLEKWRAEGRLPLVHVQFMGINAAVRWLITGKVR